MTSLDERLRDLPPERYARGARAAADLAIRAAELVGRKPPADAIWLRNQTDEQLREQQQQRLEPEVEDPAHATRRTDVTPNWGDIAKSIGSFDVKVFDVGGVADLRGQLPDLRDLLPDLRPDLRDLLPDLRPDTDLRDLRGVIPDLRALRPEIRGVILRGFVLKFSEDLHNRWESDPESFRPVRAEDAAETGGTMPQDSTPTGQRR